MDFKKPIIPPSSTEAIQSIYKFPIAYKRDDAGDLVWLSSKLEIVAGSRTYSLTSYNKLTVREIDWIAAELSEWLGMSIKEKSKSEVKSQKY